MEHKGGWRTELSNDLAALVADRDSFDLATANATGQLYMQHCDVPRGETRPL